MLKEIKENHRESDLRTVATSVKAGGCLWGTSS